MKPARALVQFAQKTPPLVIPRAIRPRFGMKILFGIFKLHHHERFGNIACPWYPC